MTIAAVASTLSWNSLDSGDKKRLSLWARRTESGVALLPSGGLLI